MRETLNFCIALVALAVGLLGTPAISQSENRAPTPETDARLFAVEITTGPNWDPAKPPN